MVNEDRFMLTYPNVSKGGDHLFPFHLKKICIRSRVHQLQGLTHATRLKAKQVLCDGEWVHCEKLLYFVQGKPSTIYRKDLFPQSSLRETHGRMSYYFFCARVETCPSSVSLDQAKQRLMPKQIG